jgi:DNA-binding response OmpR family regulator
MSVIKQMILVVSPNPDRSKMIGDCMERAGYQVLIADGGQNALETIHKKQPDLVLLEWKLPDLSSLALIRFIRSDELIARPIIILEGIEMKEEDVMLGLEAGADLCLKEPFHPKVIVARVRALLRRCYA